MNAEPRIAVHGDGNWVAVSVTGEAPDAYGPAVVTELGDMVPSESREALARDLTMFAGRAQQSGAVLAAVMLTEDADSVLAYTECRPFDPEEAGLPADSDEIAAALGTAEIDPPGWQQVSTTELTVGNAVRVHLLDAGNDAEESEDDIPVVESITHIVPSTLAGSGVLLMTSWPALLAADELVAEADRLASTLTVQA